MSEGTTVELPVNQSPENQSASSPRGLIGRLGRLIGRKVQNSNEKIKESKNPETQSRVLEKRAKLERDGIDETTANKIAREEIAKELRIKRLREEAKFAYRDPKTGLRNARWIEEQLPLSIASSERSGKPLYLLITDIDDFKAFNTYHTLTGGDHALRLFSKLPAREDEPLARFGGDEFVQILNRDITEDDIGEIIRRHQEVMTEVSKAEFGDSTPIDGNSDEIPTSIKLSFGIAKYEGETPEEFLKKASVALNGAKEIKGKGSTLVALKESDGKISLKPLGDNIKT